MKRTLFLRLTLCALFGLMIASCSKNSEDTSWQEIPTKIEGSNAAFTVNGQSAVGTVEFKPTSLVASQITLTKVINGYPEVVIDATLVKQANGSFNFAGEKTMTVAPVKADAQPVIATIKISGNVTLDGKATMNIETSGAGLSVGTYQTETLILKYSDVIISGKTVVLDATSLTDINIKLTDVIPGEKECILTGLKMANGVISGEVKTAAGTTVKCEGSVKENVLTLNLNARMNDPKGWARTYNLWEYTTGELTYNGFTNPNAVIAGAGYVNYVCVTSDSDFGTSYGAMFRGIFGALLPQVLKTVTLEADGTITAEYIASPKIQFESMWVFMPPTADVVKALIPTSGWIKSPKQQLATWFEKDGKLYLKLNIASIIAQAIGNGTDAAMLEQVISQIQKGSPASIKELIKTVFDMDISTISDETIQMLLNWLNDGIPLSVKIANGKTSFYLDQKAFDPLMKMRKIGDKKTSDILVAWEMLSNLKIIPPEAAMASGLLTGISNVWSETKAFELGLDLK